MPRPMIDVMDDAAPAGADAWVPPTCFLDVTIAMLVCFRTDAGA